MGKVCSVQVREDRAFLILVGFEWAKFQKRIVLPFAETFSTFPQGRAHHIIEALGRVNVLDDFKHTHAGQTQDLELHYAPESLEAWPLLEMLLHPL